MRRTVIYLCLGILSSYGQALGQGADRSHPAAELGRLTLIEPKAGLERDFEQGYKRHLEWHRENDDPWTWLGWTIVMGDRPGTFVDATFGHTATDLDTPVAPAADSADNRLNTLPYAARLETYVVRWRPDLGPGIGDVAAHPMLQLFEFGVQPARYDDFVEALRQARDARKASDDVPHAWLEIVSGGEHARFWLLLPAARFSELELEGFALLPAALAVGLDEPARGHLGAAIRSLRSEVLRYRPDLSYLPSTDGYGDRR